MTQNFLSCHEMCKTLRTQLERQMLVLFYLDLKSRSVDDGSQPDKMRDVVKEKVNGLRLTELELKAMRRNNQMDLDFDKALERLKQRPLETRTKVSGYTYSETNSDDQGASLGSSQSEGEKARTNSFESGNSRDQLTLDIDLITQELASDSLLMQPFFGPDISKKSNLTPRQTLDKMKNKRIAKLTARQLGYKRTFKPQKPADKSKRKAGTKEE